MLSNPLPNSIVVITFVILAILVAVGVYFVNKHKESM